MNKYKLGFSIALTILCSLLTAFPHIYAQAPVSATQNSMGGIYSGGAYIWSNNPLNAWTNPAKLGFYRGISNGYFYNDHDEFELYRKRNASMMAVGWNGIGVLLPTMNTAGKFGYTIDYGEWTFHNYYDDEEYGKGTCYQTIQQYGLGINVMELFRDGDPWSAINNRFLDFSLGLTVSHYRTNADYDFDYEEEDHYYGLSRDISEYFYNGGLIAKISTFALSDLPYRLDVSLGASWLNMTEVDGIWWDSPFLDDDKQMFTNGLIYSGSAYGAILPFKRPYSFFGHTIHELFSMAYTYDYFDYEFDGHDDDMQSWGMEYGLLNTFYVRHGQNNFNPVSWYSVGEGVGFGLKLRYHDLVEYEWNYAETDYSTTKDYCWDMMMNVNLWKIITGE